MMAELTGICVTDHFTGESGKGKSQLDGHFGVKGSKLRRLVAAALHDVITPQKLFEGVSRTLGQNEKAQLFQADRSEGSTLDVDSVKQLSSMSHREYLYAEAGGAFETIVLRQQSWLGKGLRVEAAKMRKPGAASGFKLPRELAAAGSTGGAPSGAMTAAAQKQARWGVGELFGTSFFSLFIHLLLSFSPSSSALPLPLPLLTATTTSTPALTGLSSSCALSFSSFSFLPFFLSCSLRAASAC